MAVIAVVLCAGMLVLAMRSLLPAAVLAVAAVIVTLVRRRRGAGPCETRPDAGHPSLQRDATESAPSS